MRQSILRAAASLFVLTLAAPMAGAQIVGDNCVSVFGAEACAVDQVRFKKSTGLNSKLSEQALSTAVVGAKGKPVGIAAYEAGDDALEAGDVAAFLTLLSKRYAADDELMPMEYLYLALDRAAADDGAGARDIFEEAAAKGVVASDSQLTAFVDAWLLAIEGKHDAAIDRHRSAKGGMPGLVRDLSLAAMLESIGRTDQALAVYESLTPSKIEAPEHDFDPQGIVYNHVRTVISRHALLLRKEGQIEEAQAVYQRLADAEPERAVSYQAAMDAIKTGKNLDDDALTVKAGFAQSLSDLSRALQEQRIITGIMRGQRPEGFDHDRSALDQVALLLHPEDEGLRGAVIDLMYESALFKGVTHVANSAPDDSADMQISAAQAFIMLGEEDKGRSAIEKAVTFADADEKLQILYGALQLRRMLDDRKEALDLVEQVKSMATNTSEKASAHGLAASVYRQFGDLDNAAKEARAATKLDDTHERRLALATALGEAGDVNGALGILRAERIARPNDPYTLNALGYFLLLHTDKYDESYKVLYRANALAPSDPYIADSLGWAAFKLGNLKRAQQLIEFSQEEIAPHEHWEIEDHLGDIYWYQGEKDAAKTAWQKALDNRPPEESKVAIEGKIANGMTEPAPKKQPLPDVSIDETEVEQRDI